MSITSIRRTILSVLRCTALYRRAPALAAPAAIQETLPKSTAEDVVVTSDEALADVPAPTPTTPERIPVAVDDVIPGFEEVLGPVVVPVPDDPRERLSSNTIQVPREACQQPTPGSYAWFGTHPLRPVITREFAGLQCEACGLRWPAPHGESDNE